MVRLLLVRTNVRKRPGGESVSKLITLAPHQDNMLGRQARIRHGFGQIRSRGESVLPLGLGECASTPPMLAGRAPGNVAARKRAGVPVGGDSLGRSPDPVHRGANG